MARLGAHKLAPRKGWVRVCGTAENAAACNSEAGKSLTAWPRAVVPRSASESAPNGCRRTSPVWGAIYSNCERGGRRVGDLKRAGERAADQRASASGAATRLTEPVDASVGMTVQVSSARSASGSGAGEQQAGWKDLGRGFFFAAEAPALAAQARPGRLTGRGRRKRDKPAARQPPSARICRALSPGPGKRGVFAAPGDALAEC